MGQIIPFITRISASRDWTAEERARLAELGERLIAAGLKVEVVYGATEAGDPWCVVKDEHEEVLIHVARIGGAFVIHHALDDTLRQGEDLPAILAERLAWEETAEGVTPFSRQAQSLLVLVVATAFFYESARHDDGAGHVIAPHAPLGEEAIHAAAGGADPEPHGHLADEPLAASRALHAEAMAQAASAPVLGPTLAGPAPEWRSFALEDDEVGRADHGGGELSLARVTTGAAPSIPNLEVVAPAAPAPLAAAFGGLFAPHALPLVSPPQTAVSPPQSTLTASFRPTAPDHPEARTPPTEEHPVVVASHWVDVDLDGDGKPDVRVAVPDEVKPPSGEPAHVAAADHEVILAVGHGFPHALIA